MILILRCFVGCAPGRVDTAQSFRSVVIPLSVTQDGLDNILNVRTVLLSMPPWTGQKHKRK